MQKQSTTKKSNEPNPNETMGIMLMAFGKPQYAQMAYNMAFSIKAHTPDVKIQIVYDKECLGGLMEYERWVFDVFTELKKADLTDSKTGKFSPGKAKTRMDEYAAFDRTIYLDVDGICLKDITPLLDHCKTLNGYFYAQSANWWEPTAKVPTHNLKRDGLSFPAMQWALPEKIWQVHKLSEEAEVTAINSSFAMFRKGKECSEFFEQVRDNIDNGLKPGEFSLLWGGTYPDELAFNIACAQKRVDPSAGINPVWFQFGKPLRDIDRMTENFSFLGLYGGRGSTHMSAWEYYDRLLHKMHRERGFMHKYKSQFLIKVKHQAQSTVLRREN